MRTEPTAEEINAFRVAVELEVLATRLRKEGRIADTSELRVVDLVELWHPSVPEEAWREWLTGSRAEFLMLVTRCCSRNPWSPPWLMGKAEMVESSDRGMEFVYPERQYVCPGCGNPIKRP